MSENYSNLKWRTLTQAVEHSLHALIRKSPSILLDSYYTRYEPEFDSFKIISDTTRTTPKSLSNQEWHFANAYSEKVLNEVLNYIT